MSGLPRFSIVTLSITLVIIIRPIIRFVTIRPINIISIRLIINLIGVISIRFIVNKPLKPSIKLAPLITNKKHNNMNIEEKT